MWRRWSAGGQGWTKSEASGAGEEGHGKMKKERGEVIP